MRLKYYAIIGHYSKQIIGVCTSAGVGETERILSNADWAKIAQMRHHLIES
jgi:hypothetical protein